MFHKLLFFLFPILFLQSTPFSKDAPPAWVTECDFALESAPLQPSQVNLQHLLIDVQRNWEEKTVYAHYVIKVITQAGLEKAAQLSLEFDPAYQHLVVHAIRVFRDGAWHSRLETSRHHLIQRETELEYNLYNGDLTVVYFIDDVRLGDVIEYAYSKVGHHPIFSSHYTDMLYFQSESSIEKISRRLLIHPERSFSIRPFHTSLEPRITELSPTLQEWVWEAHQTPPLPSESWQPTWYNPYARIQNSQYTSWEQVVKTYLPLYAFEKEFASPEMITLVEKWKETSPDPTQQTLLALRFVQDEVRYLGLEDGISDNKPSDPKTVFHRRFGDCKDKAILLQALLQLMNIPSTPLLVNTHTGRRLLEILPATGVFNHAILQINIDNTPYWVDPTSRLQGGSLKESAIPDYHWGLLITEKTTHLTPIPPTPNQPIEIETALIFTSPLSADLKIEWTFHGLKADRMRRHLEWKGLKKLTEEYLADRQKDYKGATPLFPLTVIDDRSANVFTITGTYHIASRNRLGKKVLKVVSLALNDYLDSAINLERSAPYAIEHPLWVKEHIHIENPFNDWHPESEHAHSSHESIHFTYSHQKEHQTADFTFELHHLQDHVPTHAIQTYWDIITEIEPNPALDLVITSPRESSEKHDAYQSRP